MKKNKIAVNAKYFKKSKVEKIIGHVNRIYAKDKNVIPELSKSNFGTSPEEINSTYKSAISKAKGIKSTSNTLIDAVLVLPLEQLSLKTMSKAQLGAAIEKTMKDIASEAGFTPCGYQVHLDEGHVDEATGKTVLNPHVHMLFANFCTEDVTLKLKRKVTRKGVDGKALRDPLKPSKWLYELDDNGKAIEEDYEVNVKDKMPLQYLRSRGSDSVWSRMQDLAAQNLAEYGFERGVSKEITDARHLSKIEFVKSKTKNLKAENISLKAENSLLKKAATELERFLKNTMTFMSAAIRGDLKVIAEKEIELARQYEHDLNELNRGMCETVLHDYVDEFQDAIKPECSPFVDSLQKSVDQVNKRNSIPELETPRPRPKL